MTTPRRPFGRERPGQLLATRLKILAAEITESQRLSRGKMYFSDDAVIDLEIRSGLVVALVQGSRSDPYRVELATTAAGDIPRRNELTVRCNCDDLGAEVCKHAVAALFALAQEISIDPEVLDRWADSTRAPTSAPVAPTAPAGTSDEGRNDQPPEQHVDVLADSLIAPAEFPRVPILPPLVHPMIAHRVVRAAMHQSLEVLVTDPDASPHAPPHDRMG